jgi:hypothetical protein
MRKVIAITRSIKDNLRDLSIDILIAYILTVDLRDDITTTTTETYRQPKWPTVESIRRSISKEYQSKLNARKTKPTASAQPSINNEPKLNLMVLSRKRKGEHLTSPSKRQETSNNNEEKKGRQE